MLRLPVLLLLAALTLLAATLKLYMKDGTYQLVREYKVEEGRVRYYSVERSDWEEIPVDLIDLKRTQAEIKAHEDERRADAVALDAEDKAERAQRKEFQRIPNDAGLYAVEGETLRTFKLAESKVVTNKGRSILKVLSPIPMVAGKATLELDATSSSQIVTTNQPEFYLRLSSEERFALVRCTPKKASRVVQRWNIIPITSEIIEEQDEVETYRRQLEDGLYKIWPAKPLQAGEYAVIEYTSGTSKVQVWDFSCRPAKTTP
jgi:hypothetical protein